MASWRSLTVWAGDCAKELRPPATNRTAATARTEAIRIMKRSPSAGTSVGRKWGKRISGVSTICNTGEGVIIQDKFNACAGFEDGLRYSEPWPDCVKAKAASGGEPMIRWLIALAVAAVALAGGFWALTIPATPAAVAEPHSPDLANGREMFYAGGCASCHAVPRQPDHTRLGGGRALKSPFGTFYVPNISSDRRDGIGGWSESNFIAAMRHGVSPAGEHLYPAFPYTSYRNMRESDVRDLFAYLQTLPPVAGRVRGHD